MILNSRLHRERNILWKTWAEPTEQNRPQQKAGANNSIILGHFQKCLTEKCQRLFYFRNLSGRIATHVPLPLKVRAEVSICQIRISDTCVYLAHSLQSFPVNCWNIKKARGSINRKRCKNTSNGFLICVEQRFLLDFGKHLKPCNAF